MKQPLYKQLYAALREEIISGALPDGSRLPSKRAMAEESHMSVVTVQNAYDRLIAEGYVRADPRRGYFVSFARERLEAVEEASKPKAAPPVSAPAWRYDFKSPAAAVEGFPFSSWAKLMREVLSEKDAALLAAPDPRGIPELRREIARTLSLTRGLHCSPDQIVVGAGSDYLVNLICQLLGVRTFAVEDPGYTKAARIYENLGARVHYIPADDEGIRIDRIRAASPAAVHVTPSHSFPAGIVMSPSRRAELLAWVGEDAGRYLIEDDFENEFCYTGRSRASLSTMDTSGRVIYMNTFTRTLAPSMRIGYIVLPPPLLAEYDRRLSHLSSTVPTLEQHVLARFLADGSFERHVRRLRSIYRRRRDTLIAALDREFAGSIRVIGHDAGVHVLGELCGMDAAACSRAARDAVILLPTLAEYSREADVRDAVVFHYAGMCEEDIDAAIRLLAAALRS